MMRECGESPSGIGRERNKSDLVGEVSAGSDSTAIALRLIPTYD